MISQVLISILQNTAGVLTCAFEALMKERCFEKPRTALTRLRKAWFLPVAGARDCEELGPRSKEREQLLQSRRGSWWEERCSIWFGVLFSSQPSSHVLKLLPLTTVDLSVV